MQETIIQWLSDFPKGWATFFMAMMPITELRASIPVAILKYGLSPLEALFWSVSANAMLGSIVVLTIEPITNTLIKKSTFFNKLWQKYIGRLHEKHKRKFDKWESWALVLFVAIPLPVTGAFSGAVAASIFRIKPTKAIPLLALGCLIAGTIVTVITLFFK